MLSPATAMTSGLDACVPRNSVVEILTTNAMALGGAPWGANEVTIEELS